MALTLDSASFAYPVAASVACPALDGATFSVAAGELVLVLGATGSGKSTLLKLLAGLLSPTAGAALLDGQPLAGAGARGAVGLVFQDPEAQLFADTVAEDVAFGPRNLGKSREEARTVALETLREVGLEPDAFAERSPFALSGGEARRAAIAGVLAMRPRYLLLDEPTAGLDARGRAAVRDIVAAQRVGSGVVVVSHSAAEFLAMATRVVLLTGGRITFDGPAEQVVAHPEAFDEAGLVAPDVVRVQQLSAGRGGTAAPFTLDVAAAARNLAGARGVG